MTRIIIDLPDDDPRPGALADLLADLDAGGELAVHVWRPARRVGTVVNLPARVEHEDGRS